MKRFRGPRVTKHHDEVLVILKLDTLRATHTTSFPSACSFQQPQLTPVQLTSVEYNCRPSCALSRITCISPAWRIHSNNHHPKTAYPSILMLEPYAPCDWNATFACICCLLMPSNLWFRNTAMPRSCLQMHAQIFVLALPSMCSCFPGKMHQQHKAVTCIVLIPPKNLYYAHALLTRRYAV